MVFHIKQDDTSPAIRFQLQNHRGEPVDISGFEKLRFHMQKENSTEPTVLADTDRGVSAPDVENGIVQYDWSPEDTSRPGDYEAEFEITFSGGRTETFPNRRNISVEIEEEIQ